MKSELLSATVFFYYRFGIETKIGDSLLFSSAWFDFKCVIFFYSSIYSLSVSNTCQGGGAATRLTADQLYPSSNLGPGFLGPDLPNFSFVFDLL
jgi:hypothetical protein